MLSNRAMWVINFIVFFVVLLGGFYLGESYTKGFLITAQQEHLQASIRLKKAYEVLAENEIIQKTAHEELMKAYDINSEAQKQLNIAMHLNAVTLQMMQTPYHDRQRARGKVPK